MVITKEIFQAFLECETKSLLRFQHLDEDQSEFRDWQRQLFQDFKHKCSAHLHSSCLEGECSFGTLPTDQKEINQHRLVIDCKVQAKELQTHIDALERTDPLSKAKHYPYIPIRFVPNEKITQQDKLLVAFDALALSASSGKTPSFGKLIYGSGLKILKVKFSGLMRKVKSIVRKIIAQQENSSPPPLILNKHCAQCGFQSKCRRMAVEKDDLSLLSGMSLTERKRHQDRGIFSVTQLSYTFRYRRQSKHLPRKAEKYHHSLKALAIREQKIHLVGRPELNITGTPVYLDVEGVPDRNFYYLIGTRVKSGESYIQRSFWADETSEESKIWASFLQYLATIKNPQLIHYGSYETVFLKRMNERYGKTYENAALVDRLLNESVNLLSIIYAQVYFPTYSNGLKEIARYRGFQWSSSEASGLSSLVWRSKWEDSKDSNIKQKLIIYNSEDCEALERTTAAIIQLGQEGNRISKQGSENIVYADSLKQKSSFHFGDNYFSIPELERINQSAYWDYQRDKVYVRSSKRLKHITKQVSGGRHKPPPINTTITDPSPSNCPKCNSTSLYKHGRCSKVVRDLKFSQTGLKRWVVRYRFHRYICRICAFTFNSQQGHQSENKYGLNLLAYIIYQVIELRIPQLTVTQSLNQLFDLQLERATLNRQKSRAAFLYKDTYEGILNKILIGKLIHADETKINIKGKTAYVWVLTNLEEVAYFYTDTREGELIQSMLQNFKGVLVSDFYAAYDSIDCPQQKCLIHLMRDLNDDLMKNPFNEEFKQLAQRFTELLKPMIDTIDRFGLKTRFLRKHKRQVERFYKNLLRSDFKTEIAIKCQKRFDKNRNRLFTFLGYDGVPWNNNNAEHAIKAFAMLRNVIRGTSTEKGIREYLVLLSICETCKYKGITFLDFLRSGETDIDKFFQ